MSRTHYGKCPLCDRVLTKNLILKPQVIRNFEFMYFLLCMAGIVLLACIVAGIGICVLLWRIFT